MIWYSPPAGDENAAAYVQSITYSNYDAWSYSSSIDVGSQLAEHNDAILKASTFGAEGTDMLDVYPFKRLIKYTQTITTDAKDLTKILSIAEHTEKGLAIIGLATAGADIYENGFHTGNTIDAAASIMALFCPVCGVVYGAIDLTTYILTGKSAGELIQEKIGDYPNLIK